MLRRRVVLIAWGSALLSSGVGLAQTENPPINLATWDDEIAKGLLPYHQLKVEDFRVADQTDAAFRVKGFIDPHYRLFLKAGHGGFVYAYIDQWVVFSGFDRNESWRKSSFRDMKVELPYAQTFIDITEIYGRQLAAIQTGQLPFGRGASPDAAQADLAFKVRVMCAETYGRVEAECNAFAKATEFGRDKKKVRELSAAVRKRLEAWPTPSQTPSPTPSPAASAHVLK
ncbi:MAG TPA: hypothetical protein VIW21_12730 [Chthoniobacterales bacterium]